MLRAILRHRTGSLTVSALVAGLTYAQTDLGGVSRIVTTGLAFVVAYLLFNATSLAIASLGSRE
ncbi:MAG: hypothetical protein ABEH83_05450 [Halobacterium sp.]